MLAQERHRRILEILEENGAVSTAYLIEHMGISSETVRRDLLFMEKAKLLQRVHGGAVALNKMKEQTKLRERLSESRKEKTELSLNAASFINDGDTLFIDCGSTCAALAEVLADKKAHVNIVTNSIDVFEILKKSKAAELILCGGLFGESENAFYGDLTVEMISGMHFGKAFISPSAISLKHGIFDYENDFISIQKKVIEVSNEVFVLADSGKFEKTALLKLDDVKPEYTYITDSSLPPGILAIYKENGMKIIN